MNNYGEIFRILRKERSFTLKRMSEGIISFSYLSKFEKGESDITLNNFTRLIERLNVSADEFFYFSGNKSNQYTNLLIKVAIAYEKNDHNLLLRYSKSEKELYAINGNNQHKYNAIMILVIAQDISRGHSIPRDDINMLVDYIIKCLHWSSYEISLLGNSITIFTDELLIILLEEIKKRLEEHKINKKNIRDLIALIENTCLILLRKKEIEHAKSLSKFIGDFIEPNYFFEKTRKNFIDGIIIMYEINKEEGAAKVYKAIDIMREMNPQLAEDYYSEYKHLCEVLDL